MIVFRVPASITGSKTLNIYGSKDVRFGIHGESLDFRVWIHSNPELELVDLEESPSTIISGVLSDEFNYSASGPIDTGASGTRYLYLHYNSYETFGPPARTTALYNVTFSNPDRDVLAMTKSSARGRFV